MEQKIEKHLSDLDERAYSRGYGVFSEFLKLDEISTLKNMKAKSVYTLYGGYDGAERCVAGFGCESTEDFPIKCIEISPVNRKFSDNLTHRDVLGAVMNLGINRNTLGDIKLRDNTAYLFCLESISGYITDSLTQIKHTTVKAQRLESLPEFINELPDESELNVSSLRADAVVSAVYKLSRNASSQLFSTGKVFINSRECEKEASLLNESDVISVRGYGKFIFEGEVRKAKKDRSVISVRIYK